MSLFANKVYHDERAYSFGEAFEQSNHRELIHMDHCAHVTGYYLRRAAVHRAACTVLVLAEKGEG